VFSVLAVKLAVNIRALDALALPAKSAMSPALSHATARWLRITPEHARRRLREMRVFDTSIREARYARASAVFDVLQQRRGLGFLKRQKIRKLVKNSRKLR
jgi:hypothetical protein